MIKFLTGWQNATEEEIELYKMFSGITGPLWVEKDYLISAFDTGNVSCFPSYVMMGDDCSEVAVYAIHGVYPDPGYSFTLPVMCEKAE